VISRGNGNGRTPATNARAAQTTNEKDPVLRDRRKTAGPRKFRTGRKQRPHGPREDDEGSTVNGTQNLI